jgi:phosphoribosylformylglycinamidine synthase
MPTARVTVQLKPTVLDAQGATVQSALHNLGYSNVRGVRVGKSILLELDEGDDLESQVREMCDRLLANPVIESYQVEVL